MTYHTCGVCGVSSDLSPLRPFSFSICLCDGCVASGDKRREELIEAIVEVLRS